LGGVRVQSSPFGHVRGEAQIAVDAGDLRVVASGDYKNVPDPTCVPFELVQCDVFITEATFALPVFRHGDPDEQVAKLLSSAALFSERAHLVGAYFLGKAQRVIALLRQAGHAAPIYLHGAMESVTGYYVSRGIALGELRRASFCGSPRAPRSFHHATRRSAGRSLAARFFPNVGRSHSRAETSGSGGGRHRCGWRRKDHAQEAGPPLQARPPPGGGGGKGGRRFSSSS